MQFIRTWRTFVTHRSTGLEDWWGAPGAVDLAASPSPYEQGVHVEPAACVQGETLALARLACARGLVYGLSERRRSTRILNAITVWSVFR